jgi:hypothetical protein
MGALQGKPGGGAPVLGTLKDMYRKALEMGIFLHRGPTGDHEGDTPYQGLQEKGEILSVDLIY